MRMNIPQAVVLHGKSQHQVGMSLGLDTRFLQSNMMAVAISIINT